MRHDPNLPSLHDLDAICDRVIRIGRVSTVPTRWMLIAASVMWAGMLYAMPYVMQRPVYSIMASILQQDLWLLAFALHAALASISLNLRGTVADAVVQSYGAVLWLLSAWSMLIAIPTPGLTGEIVISLSSVWVAYRSWRQALHALA